MPVGGEPNQQLSETRKTRRDGSSGVLQLSLPRTQGRLESGSFRTAVSKPCVYCANPVADDEPQSRQNTEHEEQECYSNQQEVMVVGEPMLHDAPLRGSACI